MSRCMKKKCFSKAISSLAKKIKWRYEYLTLGQIRIQLDLGRR